MSDIKISCPHCEQHIALDAGWAGKTLDCPACGKQFQVAGQAPAVPSAAPGPATQTPPPQAPGLRINRPGAPSAPPPLSPQPSASTRRPMPRPAMAGSAVPRTSGLAIASLILSFFGCLALGGVVCGHIARKQMRRDPSLGGRGLTTAALVIGYFNLVVCAFIIIGLLLPVIVSATRTRSRQVQRAAPTLSTVDPRNKPKPAIPSGAVAGNINGQEFNYSKSTMNKTMSMLTISDGEDFFADRELKVFLFGKPDESIENREWKISATGPGMHPHLHLSWQVDGRRNTEIVSSGYEMTLKTGAIENGVLTGTLNLEVTGKTPASLNGKFAAVVE